MLTPSRGKKGSTTNLAGKISNLIFSVICVGICPSSLLFLNVGLYFFLCFMFSFFFWAGFQKGLFLDTLNTNFISLFLLNSKIQGRKVVVYLFMLNVERTHENAVFSRPLRRDQYRGSQDSLASSAGGRRGFRGKFPCCWECSKGQFACQRSRKKKSIKHAAT